MKLSKTTVTLLAAAGLISLSASSNAQNETSKHETNKPPVVRPGGGPGGRGLEARINELSNRLKLTDEQKPKVKAILEEQDKKRAELRSLTQEERRAKMPALNEETAKKLKEVLTPDQFAKYEEFAKQRGPRPGGPGAPEGAHDGAQHEGAHPEKPADAGKK